MKIRPLHDRVIVKRVEEEKKGRARCQPQPNSGRNRELAGTIACHRNKMKTCHDPKIRSDRELRSRCGYNIHRRLIKASRRYA